MLKVNGKDAKITKTKFMLSKYTNNGIPSGYCGYLEVCFELQGKKGYFDFDVDIIKEKEISWYQNKEYSCIPEDIISEINYLEIFDTNHFYDIGMFVNPMKVVFGEIKDHKMSVKVMIEEETVSIVFDDTIDVIN